MNRAKAVVLRDLAIFQLKLFLDGFSDLLLMPVAVAAAAADVIFPGERVGHRFYAVMRLGERFDGWLNLFGAAQKAEATRDGLFGASRAGNNSLLGRLESIVLGGDEPEIGQPRRAA